MTCHLIFCVFFASISVEKHCKYARFWVWEIIGIYILKWKPKSTCKNTILAIYTRYVCEKSLCSPNVRHVQVHARNQLSSTVKWWCVCGGRSVDIAKGKALDIYTMWQINKKNSGPKWFLVYYTIRVLKFKNSATVCSGSLIESLPFQKSG